MNNAQREVGEGETSDFGLYLDIYNPPEGCIREASPLFNICDIGEVIGGSEECSEVSNQGSESIKFKLISLVPCDGESPLFRETLQFSIVVDSLQ